MTQEIKRKKIFVMPSYIGLNYVLNNFDLDDDQIFFVSSNQSFRSFVTNNGLKLLKLKLSEGLDRSTLMANKRCIDSFASSISDSEIYFFFYLSAIQELYLVKKLAVNNQVNYIDFDPKLPNYSYKEAFKSGRLKPLLIARAAYGLIFGIHTRMYVGNQKVLLGARLLEFVREASSGGEMFLKSNSIKLIQKYGFSNVDILYVDNISQHFPESAKLVSSILLDLQYRGYSILIKPHPTFKIHDDFKKFELIHEAVPADICIHFAEHIIGVSSLSLNFSTTKRVISLLHLINLPAKFIDEKIPQLSKNIWFPKSIDQLVRNFDALDN
jgi:hypothetical protein